MRRLLIVPTVLLALLAGAAIAGRPTAVDHDIRFADIPPTTTSTTTLPPATTTSTTSTTSVPDTTDVAVVTAVDAATGAPETAAEGGEATVAPSETPVPASASASPTTLPRIQPMAAVSVVVANAASRGGLANATASGLETLGYEGVIRTDGTSATDDTAIYHRAGFEREAARLARQLGFEGDVLPIPTDRTFVGDDDLDLLVWLGRDWDSVTNIELPAV